MKYLVAVLFLISFAFAKAQSVNDFKYVIVENQYEFQKKANQYRLNELMYFLMEKYGFQPYMSDSTLPADSFDSGCNAMKLKVEESGFFWTDITASLVDCRGNVLFTTATARTQIKEYEKAYYVATREAFESFGELNYSYNGGPKNAAPTVEQVNVVDDIQEDLLKDTDVSATKTAAIETRKEVEEIPATSQDQNRLPEERMNYSDPSSNGYALKFDGNKDKVIFYKQGVQIGTGRRSGNGVYLMTTNSFTGIGFIEGDNFIIEYDVNGSTQRVVMVQ